jgi:hypothetical protein
MYLDQAGALRPARQWPMTKDLKSYDFGLPKRYVWRLESHREMKPHPARPGARLFPGGS